MLGEECHPWGDVLVLPIARHPGLFCPIDLLYLACRPCSAHACLTSCYILVLVLPFSSLFLCVNLKIKSLIIIFNLIQSFKQLIGTPVTRMGLPHALVVSMQEVGVSLKLPSIIIMGT